MTRNVFCEKYKISMPGMAYAPYPNELGKRIFEHISQQAWQDWLAHQTMLINEYRLNIMDKSAKSFLMESAEKFLFENQDEPPPGYQSEV